MKTLLILFCIAVVPAAAAAVEGAPHSTDNRFPARYQEAEPGPPEGKAIRKYADDQQEGPPANFGVQTVHDNKLFAVFQGDRVEYQAREGENAILWDIQAWIGDDYNKLYLESEGEWLEDAEEFEEAGIELFYARTISPFFDVKIGARHDFEPDPDRTFAAVGLQGLAPYWFELDATVYVSEDGDVSAALEAEYDILLTQRLILQPRFETAVAVQEVEEYGIGQGINDIELGLRLRYEIRREFAPYVGISWSQLLGETKNLAEDEGEDTDYTAFVAGIRFWF